MLFLEKLNKLIIFPSVYCVQKDRQNEAHISKQYNNNNECFHFNIKIKYLNKAAIPYPTNI